jgi:hypothetical protein
MLVGSHGATTSSEEGGRGHGRGGRRDLANGEQWRCHEATGVDGGVACAATPKPGGGRWGQTGAGTKIVETTPADGRVGGTAHKAARAGGGRVWPGLASGCAAMSKGDAPTGKRVQGRQIGEPQRMARETSGRRTGGRWGLQRAITAAPSEMESDGEGKQ